MTILPDYTPVLHLYIELSGEVAHWLDHWAPHRIQSIKLSRDTTVVMPDSAFVGTLCGANDANIRYMERLLATRILPHGNELHLDSRDQHTQEIFLQMIDALRREVQTGRTISSDMIQAIYDSLTDDNLEPSQQGEIVGIDLNGVSVYPRNRAQASYIDLLRRHGICFSIGPAGTGKTFLGVAYALQQLLQGHVRKLVLTRPVMEVGERLGFLPGDMTQKLHSLPAARSTTP